MTLQIITGAQWGDEGKGRIVDWFAAQADLVARFNGGDNAGHSVTVGETLFKLHLVPSGIIHPKPVAVLGNGMVLNLRSLAAEVDMLQAAGIEITPARLRISHAAHIITPAHTALDAALEAARGGSSIGTTGRGIGPAYTSKAERSGLRMADLLAVNAGERIFAHVEACNRTLRALNAQPLNPTAVAEELHAYAQRFAPFVADTAYESHQTLAQGGLLLAEGAQGTLLDIDHGTYPYVTSSATVAAGVFTGLGLGVTAAQNAVVTGVCKCFQTRVGSGPFPTEVDGDLALRLRGSGANPWDEYGTTTGRPRRVGWLDGVLLRYAARINGLTELVITKLDILSGFESLKLCVAYTKDGKTYPDLPFGPTELEGYEPVYEEMPGWEEDLSPLRDWDALPEAARRYLNAISRLTGLPVRLVSVGPEREQLVENPAYPR